VKGESFFMGSIMKVLQLGEQDAEKKGLIDNKTGPNRDELEYLHSV